MYVVTPVLYYAKPWLSTVVSTWRACITLSQSQRILTIANPTSQRPNLWSQADIVGSETFRFGPWWLTQERSWMMSNLQRSGHTKRRSPEFVGVVSIRFRTALTRFCILSDAMHVMQSIMDSLHKMAQDTARTILRIDSPNLWTLWLIVMQIPQVLFVDWIQVDHSLTSRVDVFGGSKPLKSTSIGLLP